MRGVTPNPATFLIRTAVAIMNCISYFAVVNRDYLKISITIVSICGLVAILIYSFCHGKLVKLRAIEYVCMSFAVIIGVVWKMTGDPVLANILLQLILILSFYPTFAGIVSGRQKEEPLPWALAGIAYLLFATGNAFDWHVSGYKPLIHPLTSGVLGNSTILLAIYLRKKIIFAECSAR